MNERPYVPVNCEFNDELESASTLGKPVVLEIRLADGKIKVLTDVIADLGITEINGIKAEFMTLKSGLNVRFDDIISIDGKLNP